MIDYLENRWDKKGFFDILNDKKIQTPNEYYFEYSSSLLGTFKLLDERRECHLEWIGEEFKKCLESLYEKERISCE